jgi:hypothetical protein
VGLACLAVRAQGCGLGACRALGIEAKIWMGEGRFRRFCRVIVGSFAPKSDEICTVQTDLLPIIPKSDRLLDFASCRRPSLDIAATSPQLGFPHVNHD